MALKLTGDELRVMLIYKLNMLAQNLAQNSADRDKILTDISRLHQIALDLPIEPVAKQEEEKDEPAPREMRKDLN